MDKTVTLNIFGRQYTLNGPEGDTYLNNHLQNSDQSEGDILSLLSVCLKDTSTFLDVGANLGFITLSSSALIARGKIYSFEPAHSTYKYLVQNVKQNKLKNVKALHYGLSNVEATAHLSYNQNNLSGAFVDDGVIDHVEGHETEDITLYKLDDTYKKLGITECDFIKVDVEGHEPNFLKGAGKFIAKYKPEAFIEANHWCLNVFNRTSLPDFIDEVFKHFTEVFAVHNGIYLDLSDKASRYSFYYENVVNNQYANIYCGFDKNSMISKLSAAFKYKSTVKELNETISLLNADNKRLATELTNINNSKSQKVARKINRIIGR